jgi:chemotaxis response regulator CheB
MSVQLPSSPPLPVAVVSVSPVLLNLLSRGLAGHPGVDVVATGNLHGDPLAVLADRIRGAALLVLDFDPTRPEDVRRGSDLRTELGLPVRLFVPDLEPPLAASLRRQGFPVVRRRPDLLSLTTADRITPLYDLILAVAMGRSVTDQALQEDRQRRTGTGDRQPGAAPSVAENRRPGAEGSPVQPVESASTGRAPELLVVIGASTGGPQVVRRVLQTIPSDPRWAIAIVQHISPAFAEGFARWLTESTHHVAILAVDGSAIFGGSVVVAPGDTHLTVSRERWHLDHGPKRLFQRPSADNLFESAAKTWRERTIGVLLTGMGRDGGEGCRMITDAGGYTVVQDEATSAVYGMPRAAVESGGASEVAPLEAIGDRVVHVLKKRALSDSGSSGSGRQER